MPANIEYVWERIQQADIVGENTCDGCGYPAKHIEHFDHEDKDLCTLCSYTLGKTHNYDVQRIKSHANFLFNFLLELIEKRYT